MFVELAGGLARKSLGGYSGVNNLDDGSSEASRRDASRKSRSVNSATSTCFVYRIFERRLLAYLDLRTPSNLS